ncbi:MAG: EAL domain-containing protein, partial [Proteobacteria bacterium]|nr:EAL domain-containing protein [Pseudomonadota bacterium]
QLPGVMAARERSRTEQDRLAEIAGTIPGVVYQRVVRPDGEIRYTYISEGAKDLFGVDAQTIVRDPQALFNHYHADYRQSFREKLIEASKNMSVWDVEAHIERPDGTTRYTHAIAHPRKLDDGSVLWTGVILDATRMKLAEIEATQTEAKTRNAIVESFTQGLLLYGPDDKLIVSNSKFLAINPGLENVVVPGASYVDVLKAELDPKREGNIIESDSAFEFCERLSRHHRRTGSVFERQIDGDRWILINDNPTDSGGKVVLYTDVTELKRRERHIEHIAHHDALTGLPNRVLFRKKLEEALNRAEVDQSEVAVIFIDLDRFKAVNDTLGHPIGDALLQIVGQRIQECLRATDIAARLGGDEFALVIPNNASSEALTSLAWRLIDVLSRPAMIDGHSVIVGASLGIALGRDGANSADDLLKNADLAVYRAKSDGKGTFRFFEQEMDAVAQERRALEMDLRLAIKLGQLQVHYQPQVDVFTAQMVGAEALVRWTHPTRGKVSPAEFIPLAEETGLISEIGPWVLRKACEDAASWPLAARIAVNCSPAQFQNGNFVEQVRQALEVSGLKPSRLEIEITESLLIRDTDKNLKTLWGLKDLGVRVSMDDFGTGYSSLGNLRSFPFDKIKIDRSFIADLKNSVDAAAIIRAVVSLGRSLGITTTAEGVETRDQLTYLRAEGCSEVQGFYYSEARPPEDIHAMLVSSPNGVINPR